jgi:hypothetical protein
MTHSLNRVCTGSVDQRTVLSNSYLDTLLHLEIMMGRTSHHKSRQLSCLDAVTLTKLCCELAQLLLSD